MKKKTLLAGLLLPPVDSFRKCFCIVKRKKTIDFMHKITDRKIIFSFFFSSQMLARCCLLWSQ